jgi:hypothetical protein
MEGEGKIISSSVNGRFRVKTTEVRRVHVHSSLLVVTWSEQVKNEPFEEGVDGFNNFSLIFSYFIFYPESSLLLAEISIVKKNQSAEIENGDTILVSTPLTPLCCIFYRLEENVLINK